MNVNLFLATFPNLSKSAEQYQKPKTRRQEVQEENIEPVHVGRSITKYWSRSRLAHDS